MNPQSFVNAVKIQTSDSAASSTLKQFKNPSGQSPDPALLRLSEWFLSLSKSDQAMAEQAMRQSAKQSVFNFFCLLDGVKAFENQPSQGKLELYYVNGQSKILLNDPKQEELHNLFSES